MAAVERPPPANNRRRPRDHAWGVVKPSTAHRRVVQPAGPVTVLSRRDMFEHFQPWVVNTYGDSAKTKTITQRKYARIVKTLRGEESNSAENSKFRFWVKAKGFRMGPPPGQPIRTEPHRHKQLTLLGEPELYVPTTAVKDGSGKDKHLFKKVAVVENFFDIIYNVHVDMEGRAGKHAGQKRTYRAITETYAFLPREAVTKFLLQCTDCQRRPTVTDNSSASPSPPPLPLLPIAPAPGATPAAPVINNAVPQQLSHSIASIAAHPPPALPPTPIPALITAVSESCTPTPIPAAPREPSPPMTLGSHCGITSHPYTGGRLDPPDIDFSLPITTTYLKHMRSLGYTDEDALKIDVDDVSTPEPDGNDEDQYSGSRKDADKLKLMLLAWNYHTGRNGDLRLDDPRDLPSEEGALWGGYHGLGLKKGAREQSSPVGDRGTTHETSSVHDETSSSGNKEDDDDDDDDAEDKIDSQQYDPERLKAFNMFVRLFVDENLDRMVPISKQPKEKIQAIIDSCTRQFPEFAERARKRIRTYLKSCRRTKRTRDQNGWDSSRPTPAHLTSVQAEQILAQACENESHNAKRMRLGLEPVSQPMPVAPSERPPVDHFSSMVKSESVTTDSHSISALTSYAKMDTNNTVNSQSATTPPKSLAVTPVTSAASLNGSAVVTSAATPGAPTTLYRPNFSQAFQRTATAPYPTPLFPTQPFGSTGMMTNGPTDLSMKNTTKPLLSHKLNSAEMAAVRQLITGYRESAAFLLRSADELEQLLLQQQ